MALRHPPSGLQFSYAIHICSINTVPSPTYPRQTIDSAFHDLCGYKSLRVRPARNNGRSAVHSHEPKTQLHTQHPYGFSKLLRTKVVTLCEVSRLLTTQTWLQTPEPPMHGPRRHENAKPCIYSKVPSPDQSKKTLKQPNCQGISRTRSPRQYGTGAAGLPFGRQGVWPRRITLLLRASPPNHCHSLLPPKTQGNHSKVIALFDLRFPGQIRAVRFLQRRWRTTLEDEVHKVDHI